MKDVISFEALSEFIADSKPTIDKIIISKENSIEVLGKICNHKGLTMILLSQIYSIQEVAQIYKVHERTIYRNIKKAREKLNEI